MTFADGLQSAVMYRAGKLFHGCSSLFVFFPLLIYVASTTFLLAVEGSEVSPSQGEIKKAQKIVERFLRNEAGSTWLSGLAKTKTAPLTAIDFMNAILETTRPEGKVWKAASILSEALEARTPDGVKPDSFMGQNETWKNLIADVEKEDDIICLYRKNTVQTAKKAEDWEKFLKTVSPGYTVHLAIDTGLKYVICLKKIDVVESTEFPSSRGRLDTATTSVFLREVTAVTPALYPTSPGRLATNPASAVKINSYNEKSKLPQGRDESCEDDEREAGDTNDDDADLVDEDDDDGDDYGFDDSFEDSYARRSPQQRLQLDSSGRFEDYPVISDPSIPRSISSPIGPMNSYSDDPRRSSYNPYDSTGRIVPQSLMKDPECKRPIILMMQGGKMQTGYRPQLPTRFHPVQQSPLPPARSSFPRVPWPSSALPRFPLDSLGPPKNLPPLMRLNNLGRPIGAHSASIHKDGPRPMFSKNTQLTFKVPSGRAGVKPGVETTRSTSGPTIFNAAPPGSQYLQRGRYEIPRRYPVYNFVPGRAGRSSVPNIRDAAAPINRPSVTPRLQQKVPARNFALRTTTNSDRSKFVKYDLDLPSEREKKEYLLRQLMLKHPRSIVNSRMRPPLSYPRPTITPIFYKPMRGSDAQYSQSEMHSRLRSPQSLGVNRGHVLPRMQNYNRINPQLLEMPRSPENIRQNSYTNPTANYYPMANSLGKPRQSLPNVFPNSMLRNPSTLKLNRFIPRAEFHPIRNNGPCYPEQPVGNQVQRYQEPCPSNCDRPVRLQIVIQGQVQEPSKISVITEPGQRVQIVGSDNPIIIPYGSRADTSGTLMRATSGEAEETMEPGVAEVERRFYDPVQQLSEREEKTSATEGIFVEGEKLKNQENSTIIIETETTPSDIEKTESTEAQLIEERFLHESTIETTPGVEVNSTVSTIMNSTLID